MRFLPRHLVFLLALATFGWLAGPGAAAALETRATEAVLLDYETGTVLMEKNADERMYPSSMTKLMTLYILFRHIEAGRIGLEDTLPVSEKAWRTGGSKMFVEVGSSVAVEDLIRGIVVQSGNDACVVVAEGLAGTEAAFARLMTETAHEIGMAQTQFRNASGWPDPDHFTTARDLARLTVHLIEDFPRFYPYFSETEFTYHEIKQQNRNPLLYRNIGADGLKTGHTEAAGYGLTASAVQDGRRLVLVVNGMQSTRERSEESEKLLLWGFREFENTSLFKAGETVAEAEVWLGVEDSVPLVLAEPMQMTVQRSARDAMTVSVVYRGPVPAPILAGQPIAELRIARPGTPDIVRPLLAGAAVERSGFFGRIAAAARHLVLSTVTEF